MVGMLDGVLSLQKCYLGIGCSSRKNRLLCSVPASGRLSILVPFRTSIAPMERLNRSGLRVFELSPCAHWYPVYEFEILLA